MIVPTVGAVGVDGCVLITTFADANEMHPEEFAAADLVIPNAEKEELSALVQERFGMEGLAMTGALVAAGGAIFVALLLGRGGQHNRRTGAILLLTYAASWPILL